MSTKPIEFAHYLPMPQHNAEASKSPEWANQHSQDAATADEAKAIPLVKSSTTGGSMNQQQIEILSLALRLAGDTPKTETLAPVANDHFIGHYCIVRSARAGVFAGTVTHRSGQEVTMTNARRIWYWDGAASLSQLATAGTSKPENCKFPGSAPNVLLMEVIEILPTTELAERSIKGVEEWVK